MNRIKKQGSLPGERCGVSLSVRFFARSVSALIFPEKPSLEAGLDEEIAYTKELLSVLEEGIAACGDKKIQDLAERIRVRAVRRAIITDKAITGIIRIHPYES